MRITFGIKGFRKWVERHEPGAVVGVTGKEDSCALAEYGKDQGAFRMSVSVSGIGIATFEHLRYQDIWRNTPRWAVLFIGTFDRLGKDGCTSRPTPVTREQCLAALDQVETVLALA